MSQPVLPAKAQSASEAGSRFRSLWLPALICLLLLGAEVYVLLHDLSGGGAAKHDKTVPIATFETGKNQVRQKNGGTILWQPPTPGQVLYRQDAIATMSNSEATVRFGDHSELVIEPDSLIIFEEASFPKDGSPAKIVARLVRGSLKRKNAGPSDLLVKLSADAQPVELADPQGGAVFRVVLRSNGIEVVVESGGVRMNGKEIKSTPPAAKLPSPNLKKPEIEIRKIKKETSLWNFIADLLLPSSYAAEAPLGTETEQRWQISIHFAWEPVPGADSYRIQIATDPEFQTIVLEKSVKETTYDYQSDLPPQPQTLYMHVAGQDASGNVGDFSPLEKVHIQSVSEISREYVNEKPTPTPSPTPKVPERKVTKKPQTPVQPPVEPKLKQPEIASNVAQPISVSRVDASYGIIYQSRTFKGTNSPTSAAASGLVPADLEASFTRFRESTTGYKIGGSYIFEVVNTGSSGVTVQNGKIGVPIFQFWGLYEKHFLSWNGGIGPYLTNTSQLTYSKSTLTSKSKILGGLLFDFDPDIERKNWAQLHGQVAVLGLGGIGADVSFGAQKQLFKDRVYFTAAKALLRLDAAENSYGGALTFGRTF